MLMLLKRSKNLVSLISSCQTLAALAAGSKMTVIPLTSQTTHMPGAAVFNTLRNRGDDSTAVTAIEVPGSTASARDV